MRQEPRITLGLAALALAMAGPLLAQVPQAMDPALVPDYAVLRPGLAASGQPTEEGLRRLQALGFKTVINLRTDAEEGVAEEEGVAKGLGLRYVRVPFTAASFRSADANAVRAVLDEASAAPVLLHCASSNRVGGVWAVILAMQGKSLDQAEAEGKRAGLKDGPMLEAARRVMRESVSP